MANIIRIKRRAAGGGAGAPTTLQNAELAFNEDTNVLYYGSGSGVGGAATSIIPIAGNGGFVDLTTNQTIGGTKTFSSTISGSINGNANTATTLATGRTISVTGDLSYTSGSFDGSGNVTGTGTLATVNSNIGSFTKVTINAKGLATAGTAAVLADLAATTADFSMNGYKLTNVANPISDTDAANKYYVDSVAQGLDVKASCLVATTVDIGLSGLLTVDGVTLTAGDRVLVKDQAAPAENGIYIVAASAWSRSPDADSWAELVSAYTFIEAGNTYADTGWVCTVNAGGTLGTTAVTWSQFSGAGTYIAGTGLTLTGNTFSITNTAVTASGYGDTTGSYTVAFTVNAQGQLTAAASYEINVDGGTF